MRKFIVPTILTFLFNACGGSTSSQNTNNAHLLFSSGFEEGVYIDSKLVADYEDYRYIRGTDSTTGFSWPIDILGASQSALHMISDDGGQAVQASIQSVVGHDGKTTKALYNAQQYEAKDDTQLPYEILNIQQGNKDLYVKYWMKIDANNLRQADTWRALFEYKTKDYKDPGEGGTGYRFIAFIYTNETGKPYWHLQGDADSEHPIWEIDNTSIPVPLNEWFLTEYYWHWSNGNDGKTLWKINGHIVGEHSGATTRNNNPIDFIILTQIYGDANPKHQWIDDIEIWDSMPN